MIKCEKCISTIINAIPLIEKNAYDKNHHIVFAMKLLGIDLHDKILRCYWICRIQYFNLSISLLLKIFPPLLLLFVNCRKMQLLKKKFSEENGYYNGLTVHDPSGDGSWQKKVFHLCSASLHWLNGSLIKLQMLLWNLNIVKCVSSGRRE